MSSSIEVLFELPDSIANGLSSGALERVGGVIRDANSKQVVIWLREGEQISQNPNLEQGVMGAVLRKSGMSALAVTSVLSTLNVGLSLYTLYQTNRRINMLETQIEQMHERITHEFSKDRKIELAGALEELKQLPSLTDIEFKKPSVSLTVSKLLNASLHFLDDFESLVSKPGISQQACQKAQNYLFTAMHIQILRIRCFLEIDEQLSVKTLLTEALDTYKAHTQTLIRRWVGNYPALYFHKDFTDDELARYLQIECWLRDEDNESDVLAALIRENRQHFWDEKIAQRLSDPKTLGETISPPFIKQQPKPSASLKRYKNALTQSEILIENYQRLLGFALELASERLTADITPAERDLISTSDDYVLLVDAEWRERYERLSIGH